MATASANGQQINYVDSGGSGPVVLFCHGFLMDHTMFSDQIDLLSDRYRCITWDERGFGETAATGPFTYSDSADDAVALLDHLGIDSAVFVGMSQGGFLSLRAALRHPDRVSAIALIDSDGAVDDAETLAGYEAIVAHWLSDEPLGDIGSFVAGLIIGEPTLMAKWVAIWEARDRQEMEHPARALLDRDDISGRVSEITCPILSIHGDADQAIDISRAEALQEAAANGRGLVRIPGAGHASNMTHPDLVNPALESFLAEVV